MRELIVLNDLKAPFTLREGQTLLLPAKDGQAGYTAGGTMAPAPMAVPMGGVESQTLEPVGGMNSGVTAVPLDHSENLPLNTAVDSSVQATNAWGGDAGANQAAQGEDVVLAARQVPTTTPATALNTVPTTVNQASTLQQQGRSLVGARNAPKAAFQQAGQKQQAVGVADMPAENVQAQDLAHDMSHDLGGNAFDVKRSATVAQNGDTERSMGTADEVVSPPEMRGSANGGTDDGNVLSSKTAQIAGDSTQTANSSSAQGVTPHFVWPLQGPVSSGFGSSTDGLNNDGMNIIAPKGSPVVAAAGGTVVYAGNEMKGFGNLVLVRHEGGWVTAYAHLDRIMVARDAVVASGDTIGTVGSTGSVAKPQLHFETRLEGKPVDPQSVIKKGG